MQVVVLVCHVDFPIGFRYYHGDILLEWFANPWRFLRRRGSSIHPRNDVAYP